VRGYRGLWTDLMTTVGVVVSGKEVEVCGESTGAANPIAMEYVKLLTGITK